MTLSELNSSEFEEFYGTYLAACHKNLSLEEGLQVGEENFLKLLNNISVKGLQHKYAPNKWTVAEVLMHIIDTERVFQYRAFRISRGDKTPLPGFEQNDYVPESNANTKSSNQIKEEYLAVRSATKSLFASLTEKQLRYTGTASNIPWSVGGTGFVISGHQEHHIKILAERYFVKF